MDIWINRYLGDNLKSSSTCSRNEIGNGKDGNFLQVTFDSSLPVMCLAPQWTPQPPGSEPYRLCPHRKWTGPAGSESRPSGSIWFWRAFHIQSSREQKRNDCTFPGPSLSQVFSLVEEVRCQYIKQEKRYWCGFYVQVYNVLWRWNNTDTALLSGLMDNISQCIKFTILLSSLMWK